MQEVMAQYIQVMLDNIENNNAIWTTGIDTVRYPVLNYHGNDIQLGNDNSINLVNQAALKNYKSQRWVSYQEIKRLSLYIKKNNKGTHLKNSEGKPVVLFNVDQLNIREDHYLKSSPINIPVNRDLEDIIASSLVKITTTDSNVASYDPIKNVIEIPDRERFDSDAIYYSTIIHELAHASTLAKGIEIVTDINDERYARQEMSAEMTAYLLCAMSNINYKCLTNSGAYIKSWLNNIESKEDRAEAIRECLKEAIVNIECMREKVLSAKIEQQFVDEDVIYLNVRSNEDTVKLVRLGAFFDSNHLPYITTQTHDQSLFAAYIDKKEPKIEIVENNRESEDLKKDLEQKNAGQSNSPNSDNIEDISKYFKPSSQIVPSITGFSNLGSLPTTFKEVIKTFRFTSKCKKSDSYRRIDFELESSTTNFIAISNEERRSECDAVIAISDNVFTPEYATEAIISQFSEQTKNELISTNQLSEIRSDILKKMEIHRNEISPIDLNSPHISFNQAGVFVLSEEHQDDSLSYDENITNIENINDAVKNKEYNISIDTLNIHRAKNDTYNVERKPEDERGRDQSDDRISRSDESSINTNSSGNIERSELNERYEQREFVSDGFDSNVGEVDKTQESSGNAIQDRGNQGDSRRVEGVSDSVSKEDSSKQHGNEQVNGAVQRTELPESTRRGRGDSIDSRTHSENVTSKRSNAETRTKMETSSSSGREDISDQSDGARNSSKSNSGSIDNNGTINQLHNSTRDSSSERSTTRVREHQQEEESNVVGEHQNNSRRDRNAESRLSSDDKSQGSRTDEADSNGISGTEYPDGNTTEGIREISGRVSSEGSVSLQVGENETHADQGIKSEFSSFELEEQYTSQGVESNGIEREKDVRGDDEKRGKEDRLPEQIFESDRIQSIHDNEQLVSDGSDSQPALEFSGEAIDYSITDNSIAIATPKVRYQNNVSAINLLKVLEAEKRYATRSEQDVLAKYVGWGGLAQAFDPTNTQWKDEFAELNQLLSTDEYDSARNSTLDSHYTNPQIINSIYKGLEKIGFLGGSILEPSCGVGNFFGGMPAEIKNNSTLQGVEIDSVSARIASFLYPTAKITNNGFQNFDKKGHFDVAIGNVPFGKTKIYDSQYKSLSNMSIHNYFFGKSLEQVRAGGVVAFITSRFTMDSEDSSVREYIAHRAEFLGAIRLPNNAFSNAGTEVVSDIIFLKKRNSLKLNIDSDIDKWVSTDYFDEERTKPVNVFFKDHPEQVIGKMELVKDRFGENSITVTDDGDFIEKLNVAMQNLEGEYLHVDNSLEQQPTQVDYDIKNFTYGVSKYDGQLYFRNDDSMELVTKEKDRILLLTQLAEQYESLIDIMYNDEDADVIEVGQKELLERYNKLINFQTQTQKKNNELNRVSAKANNVFDEDYRFNMLLSLEKYDKHDEFIGLADIFTKKTINAAKKKEVITAKDALVVSQNELGRIDIHYMASLLSNKSKDQIIEELSDVIFRDPTSKNEDYYSDWQSSSEYLSGNVREKLIVAKDKAIDDISYRKNVEALENVLPKWKVIDDITVKLEATWIPIEIVQSFVNTEIGFCKYSVTDKNLVRKFSPYSDRIKGQRGNSDYWCKGFDGYDLVNCILNYTPISVKEKINDKEQIDEEATYVAKDKADSLKMAFVQWVMAPEHKNVQTKLEEIYNNQFNSIITPTYKGDHISFDGMNQDVKLRPHQSDAIARILYGGNTLLAHEVGAGKTYEMIAAAMESKRLGLCNKSMIAVPQAVLSQFALDIQKLYPNAKVCCADEKHFDKDHRARTLGRIASGDYDIVLVTHGQMERMSLSKETQNDFYYHEKRLLENALLESVDDKISVKNLSAQLRELESKIAKINDPQNKDTEIEFEKLGIDRLFVDEAHRYKNLAMKSKSHVSGITNKSSERSLKMLMLSQYMNEKTNYKGLIFATGTPISNSICELYTMQKYLQPQILKKMGVENCDAWLSTFAEITSDYEMDPSGKSYVIKDRVSKFDNVPELMRMYKLCADIKTTAQMNLPLPNCELEVVNIPATDEQLEAMEAIKKRADKITSTPPYIDNILKIMSDGRNLGIDQRMYDPSLGDNPNSKINKLCDNVFDVYELGKDDLHTQLIFTDRGAPGNPNLNVYADITEKLIERGIPAEQIANIHEANNDKKRKQLFRKVDDGEIRVLIGATESLGTGVNVQTHLKAVHHLDIPWKPSDLVQRNGRIVRQGNKNKDVKIFQYVSERTFDTYLYQTLLRKQKFISQLMTASDDIKSVEDADELVFNLAQITAICSGDERNYRKVELEGEIKKLDASRKDFERKKKAMQKAVDYDLPDDIKMVEKKINESKLIVDRINFHPLVKNKNKDGKDERLHYYVPTLLKDGYSSYRKSNDEQFGLRTNEDINRAINNSREFILNRKLTGKPVSIGYYRGLEIYLSVEMEQKGRQTRVGFCGPNKEYNSIRLNESTVNWSKRLDECIDTYCSEKVPKLQEQLVEKKDVLAASIKQLEKNESYEKQDVLDQLKEKLTRIVDSIQNVKLKDFLNDPNHAQFLKDNSLESILEKNKKKVYRQTYSNLQKLKLKVPFLERKDAEAFGAKWDKDNQCYTIEVQKILNMPSSVRDKWINDYQKSVVHNYVNEAIESMDIPKMEDLKNALHLSRVKPDKSQKQVQVKQNKYQR